MKEKRRSTSDVVLEVLTENPDGLTAQEIVRRTHYAYMENAVRNALAPLVRNGIVEKVGHRPRTVYRLARGAS